LPLFVRLSNARILRLREANEIRLSIAVIVEDASRFARDLVA
jgi:hypothetical protein